MFFNKSIHLYLRQLNDKKAWREKFISYSPLFIFYYAFKRF